MQPEEGTDPAVGIEAIVQIGPRTDFKNRLVFDQLFQQRGRRTTGQAPQLKETDVELGTQPPLQLAIEQRQFPVILEAAQQVGEQLDKIQGGRSPLCAQ